MLRFVVHGTPETAGSKRAFRRGNRVIVTDDNRKTKSWQAAVAGEAAAAMADRPLLVGPLVLTVTFTLQRPKGHFGTGRNAGQLKDSAPEFCDKRPDALKLTRAVEDALTGVVWHDDAQVVDERIVKRYGAPTGVEVTVAPLVPHGGE